MEGVNSQLPSSQKNTSWVTLWPEICTRRPMMTMYQSSISNWVNKPIPFLYVGYIFLLLYIDLYVVFIKHL